MGEDHPVTKKDVDTDAVLIKKLEEFRERAKSGRLYEEFNSPDDFKEKAIHGVARLKTILVQEPLPRPLVETRHLDPSNDPIPLPPAFYAEPPYISFHQFVGRQAELDHLTGWAAASDPHPVLLFEAIGGTGKSMLTWEWVNNYAMKARADWAGRFWYSFYEKGAIMADFCQRALAYITRRPLEELRRRKTADLAEELLRHLKLNPWLLVLDGLERVLVAYHRFDAAQVADKQIDTSKDPIADRNPCAAIRPEDEELLRLLAAAAPSKILITTRLTPRVLLNQAKQAIPGVLRVPLQGLRPPDAEALLRSCEVTGTSQLIQGYLKSHCDCHPLVIGVLAGLVNDYFDDRGNFDAWVAGPDAGAAINFAGLDLVQKRNHILRAAFAALPEKSRELLSTLALISESVDAETLKVLNPHRPPKPDGNLPATVRELERRGLLQFDHDSKRYDLHPVVRGFVIGGLQQEEKENLGQRVADHFSTQAHDLYDDAESLEDLHYGLHTIRVLLQMEHYQQAYNVYREVNAALLFNLQANEEALSLMMPFFPNRWEVLPRMLSEVGAIYLANSASIALQNYGQYEEALVVIGTAITSQLGPSRLRVELSRNMLNASNILLSLRRLAANGRVVHAAVNLSLLTEDNPSLFVAQLFRCRDLITLGRYAAAEDIWALLHPMGRNWRRTVYRPGYAEATYARLLFETGRLMEEHLAQAQQLAKDGKNRSVLQSVHALRGEWLMEHRQWTLAVESLEIAVRMVREVKLSDERSETLLALAKCHLKQLSRPREEAERLESAKKPWHLDLAQLWLAIGDREKAKVHALAAYEWAWADGEPYVHRYCLNQARALLEELGAEIPELPPYDPAKDPKLPWEDAVAVLIERLRAEKEAETAEQADADERDEEYLDDDSGEQ
jgi:hypothetical protein